MTEEISNQDKDLEALADEALWEEKEDSDISGAASSEEEEPQSQIRFADLGVEDRLLRAITELGFEYPMPIQRMVIPHLLEKEGDVVGLAQTGTGKTAAFGLPLLQRIHPGGYLPQALVIAPTRELCLQIAGDLADFAKYLDNVKIIPVYGGSSIESQIKAIKNGVQVIVATPGRLIDLIKRGVVKLNDINTVILDEADEMLNMGFVDDIKEILSHVPEERKMLMFSATMPREIAGIARDFMKDPVEFVAGNKNEGSDNVKHIYYMVKAHDKYLALKRVADNNPYIYGIIFCRTKRETQEIADKLIADGYNADCLHGDLSQAQRDLAMKKFRDHVTQLLVATDVAARGLDVDDLTHVINYGLPDDTAVYTHRSGRTGRANKTGVSVAIIHSREKSRLKEIEKKIGKTFEYKKVPTPDHIIEKQIYNLADRLERVEVNDEQISRFLPGVRKKLEWLSEEDLLKRVLSLEFNRLLDYYRDMPDIDLDDTGKGKTGRDAPRVRPHKKDDRDKESRKAEDGFERLTVNIGKAQGFFPGNLMELINKNVPGSKPAIGRIDLLPDYTLFDVRKKDARRVVDALRHSDFYGRKVSVSFANNEGKGDRSGKVERGKSKQNKTQTRKAPAYAPEADFDTAMGRKKEGKAKARKERKPEIAFDKNSKRPKYNGNYDIFKK